MVDGSAKYMATKLRARSNVCRDVNERLLEKPRLQEESARSANNASISTHRMLVGLQRLKTMAYCVRGGNRCVGEGTEIQGK